MIYPEVITEKMKNIAEVIFKNFDSKYYLAGGTAIALQIGHRESIDLDYFINDTIDTSKLKKFILDSFENQKTEFIFEEKNTLWCIIDGVKVSFISRFDPLVNELLIIDNFRLASINDLVVMKLSVICSREEYKDYFDLACLASVTDVRSWTTWWGKAYKNSDPISFIIALANTDKILEVPLAIKDNFKNISPKEILSKAVMEIKSFIM
jgi:predicted nucleotidyltransferase component of viral defense system